MNTQEIYISLYSLVLFTVILYSYLYSHSFTVDTSPFAFSIVEIMTSMTYFEEDLIHPLEVTAAFLGICVLLNDYLHGSVLKLS